MASAPPLCVGHPQVSAPEAALEHTSLAWQGMGAETAVAGVTGVPVRTGLTWYLAAVGTRKPALMRALPSSQVQVRDS